jgi:hypothetical protein
MDTESPPSRIESSQPPPLPPTRKKLSTGMIIGITCCVVAGVLFFVLSVGGILAAIALPKLFSAIETAKVGQAQGMIGSINGALSMYFADNVGAYPAAPVPVPVQEFLAPKYLSTAPSTPWQGEYFYVGDSTAYCVWCKTDKGEYLFYDSNEGVFDKATTEPAFTATSSQPREE